jgi:hypothetical protein
MVFAKDENMIQALASDPADEALREGVLPRALGRRQGSTTCLAAEVLAKDKGSAALQFHRGNTPAIFSRSCRSTSRYNPSTSSW